MKVWFVVSFASLFGVNLSLLVLLKEPKTGKRTKTEANLSSSPRRHHHHRHQVTARHNAGISRGRRRQNASQTDKN